MDAKNIRPDLSGRNAGRSGDGGDAVRGDLAPALPLVDDLARHATGAREGGDSAAASNDLFDRHLHAPETVNPLLTCQAGVALTDR